MYTSAAVFVFGSVACQGGFGGAGRLAGSGFRGQDRLSPGSRLLAKPSPGGGVRPGQGKHGGYNLHWQWRADQIADWPEVDEQIKVGDDFQARVYVVKKGWLPWQTRAINYVWSRQAAPGTYWPNPFASQAVMVVVQGPGGAGRWQSVTRNVREDFRRFHGMDVDSVDAVAIMTDGDNTGTTVASCYRLPEFRASP